MTPTHWVTEKYSYRNRYEKLRHTVTIYTTSAQHLTIGRESPISSFSLRTRGVGPHSTPTNVVIWGMSMEITLFWDTAELGIHESHRTIVTKRQFLSRDLSISQHIPAVPTTSRLSAEGADKNVHLSLSPWKKFDCILSQLVPEDLASNQPESESWLGSS